MSVDPARATLLNAAVGEMRLLLREHTQHADTALVTLMQQLLAHYGFFDDADHDPAAERRATFNRQVAEGDRAYDGWSAEPQKRELLPRERDILTRILRDAVNKHQVYPVTGSGLGAALVGGESRVMVEPGEIEKLRELRWVLDPRHD